MTKSFTKKFINLKRQGDKLTFLQSSLIARCRRVYPWEWLQNASFYTFFSNRIAAIEKWRFLYCSWFRLKSRTSNSLKSTGFRKQRTIKVNCAKFQEMPMFRVHQVYIFRWVSLNTALNVRSTAMFYSLSMLRKLNCKKRELYVIQEH